jgi:hypothetical protein
MNAPPSTGQQESLMPRALAVALVFLATPAAAIAGDLTPKQQKMLECNSQARTKGLRGDEQQKFMSACLMAKAPENRDAARQAGKR